ncbi:MAG: hypothetical protein ACREA3_01085 [Nitrosotalea sp.]
MARKDWINVGINSYLVEGIDSFLKSDGAKITGIESRQQFVNRLILEFFTNYKRKTGIVHLKPKPEVAKVPDLFDLATRKVKKKPSV